MTGVAYERGEDALARAFDDQRPRLLRVAYSTTGSLAEAEDCVQEAWLLLPFTRRPPRHIRYALVNGAPGLVVRDADGILLVVAFTVDSGRIVAVDVMRNPDKLATAADLPRQYSQGV